MKLPKEILQRLENSANRLAKLARVNAPANIIANEIGLIIQRASTICGGDMFNFVGLAVARDERRRLGYCCYQGEKAGDLGCWTKLSSDEEKMHGLCQPHLELRRAEESLMFDDEPQIKLHQEGEPGQ